MEDQDEHNDYNRSFLEMASPSAIDAAAAGLLASMDKCTSLTGQERPASTVVDDWATAEEATVEAVRARIRSFIMARRLQHNADLPINRLPIELLTYIFRRAIDHGQLRHRIRNIVTLALVATHWNASIKNTPSIWATTCGSYPSAALAAALLNSEQSPLTVHFNHSWHPRFSDHRHDITFLEAIHPHVHRFQSVDIGIRSQDPLSQYLIAPAPMLRTLRLRIQDQPSTGLPFNIFSGSAENLEDVALDCIQVPWSSGLLKGLRSISLRRINGARSMLTPDIVMDILESCPELKNLELVDLSFETWDRRDDQVNVHLPQLRQLQIGILPSFFFHLFLFRVSTPHITSLILGPPSTAGGTDTRTLPTRIFNPEQAGLLSPKGGLRPLQHVKCVGLSIPWAPGLLKGLRSLVVENVTRGAPTTDELLQVMLENPSLEILRLWSIMIAPHSTTSATPAVISLPQLKKMEMKTTPSTSTYVAVSVISAPQISRLNLSLQVEGGHPFPSTIFVPRNLNARNTELLGTTIKQAFAQSPFIMVSLKPSGDVVVEKDQKPLVINITLCEGEHLRSFAWASQLLNFSDASRVPGYLSFDDGTPGISNEINELLPQTKGITFGGEYGIVDVVQGIALLATPQRAERGSISWPFPKLSSIYSRSRVPVADVIAMVQSRTGRHPLVNGGDSTVNLPVPFTGLTFRNQEQEITDEERQAVEAVVGEGVLVWDRF